MISQLHVDAVFLMLRPLPSALLVRAARHRLPDARGAASWWWSCWPRALVGFVQYFTDLPIVLVELHLLGAATIATVMTWTLLEVREGRQRRSSTTTGMTRDATGPAPRAR